MKKFLPTPEDVGLSRYDRNSQPERYPCTKTEFAALLPSDKSPETTLIRPLLAKTNLEFRDLVLAYDANKDGWDPKSFHKKLDKKGPAVVLCKSTSGSVFGGYNPTGWVNEGELRGSIAAFLFCFPGAGDPKKLQPIKLAKISGAGLAQVIDTPHNTPSHPRLLTHSFLCYLPQVDDGQGPKFGSEGLTILLERSRPKKVRCKLGLYYERLPDGGNTFLSGGKAEDELSDLKVFIGSYAPGEAVPYSDVMFFQLN